MWLEGLNPDSWSTLSSSPNIILCRHKGMLLAMVQTRQEPTSGAWFDGATRWVVHQQCVSLPRDLCPLSFLVKTTLDHPMSPPRAIVFSVCRSLFSSDQGLLSAPSCSLSLTLYWSPRCAVGFPQCVMGRSCSIQVAADDAAGIFGM